MRKWIGRSLLKLFGWTPMMIEANPLKSVICVAPHTSNMDFTWGQLYYMAAGKQASFLIKKEWFVFPFNLLFKAMGGVPIDRSKNTSVTDQMAEKFNSRKMFHLAITPEGTRDRASEWKKGFYFIAQKAHVPIEIAYLDYKKKELGIKVLFHPTGDVDKDMETIRGYYKDVRAKHPEKFKI